MQLTDKDGNVFGTGGLEITTSDGKPKIPVINTDITIGTTAIVGGVSGRLLYDNAGVVGETNGVHWDKVNSRLGLGTTTPTQTLDIQGDISIGLSAATTVRAYYNSTTRNQLIYTNTSSLEFFQSINERMRLAPGSGNLLLNTTTDAGFKLDVNGTSRIQVSSAGTPNILSISNLQTDAGPGGAIAFYTGGVAGNASRIVAQRSGSVGQSDIALETNGVRRLFVSANDGNVGIGTTTPLDFNLVVQGILQVRNAASSFTGLRIDNSSIRKRDTSTFSLGTNDTTVFNIFAPTNNIGINTTTDAGYTLDINGTTRIQRTLDLGSVGYAGTINLRRAGDGGITSQITQTNDVTIIHNYQGSGTELKVDNVTYFHVRGFANRYAARVMGNLTAVSGLSTALIVNNAISASANNDTLIGLDIAPTFNNSAFTGVSNWGMRLYNSIRFETPSDSSQGIFWKPANDGTTLRIYGSTFSAGVGFLQLNVQSGTDGLSVNGGARTLSINAAQSSISLNLNNILFNTHGTGEAARIVVSTKNFLIGTTTDAGYKLDVNGTIRAKSDTYIGYENIAAGSTYIQINPDKFNSKIIFNDFDGGTGTRGGILEMSTYKSRLTYGSYNWFYIGDSINPFMFYIAPSTGNFVLTRQNTQPTDSGYKLDVGGTAIIRGDLSTASGKNMLFGTTLPSRQTNSAQYPAIFVGNSNSGIFGETTTGYKGINLNANIVRDTSLYWVLQDTTQPGWIVGLNYETGFTDAFSINRSPATTGTAAISTLFQVKGNGNIQIGTTTDAGYKLDVNGTARVSGALTVSGNQILFSGSASNTYITQNIGTGVGNLSAAVCMQIQVNTFPKIIVRDTGASRASTLIVGDNVATTEAAHSSALLEVRSSSAYIRGFLPPRMTTTEKNSIPTPAAGLMVYDTDLNRPCFYNGTSWITL